MQQFYERLVRFTHDGIFRYRFEDGVILLANQGLVDILDLNVTPAEIVGKPLSKLMRYLQPPGEIRRRLAETSELHGSEYHFQTLKGEERWILFDSFLGTDPETGGRVVETIITNITPLRKATRILEEERERLDVTLRSIGEGLIATDSDGRVRLMNPAAEKLTGWLLAEAAGLPLSQVFKTIDEETRATVDPPAQRVLRDGVRIESPRHSLLLSRSGGERPIADSASPLRNKSGAITGMVLVFQDQTGERAARNALAFERNKLAAAFENMAMGLILSNGQGGDITMNSAAMRFFGISSADDVRPAFGDYQDEWELSDPDGRIIPFNDWPAVRATRGDFVRNLEVYYRSLKTGRTWICSLTSVPVRNSEGNTTLIVQTLLDITEARQREEQLRQTAHELARSNRELERFAYVSSHDLNEPLRMVSAFTKLLRDRYQGRLDATADQYIAFALEGAERMRALIAGILDYSRLGNRERLRLLNAGEPLRAALDNLKSAIDATGADVEVGPLPDVTADDVQLTQVFQNLIGNALKFRGKAPPRIRISAARIENAWQFSVEDNGIGIDPAYWSNIFGVFQRLHTQDQYPGTGIGLATCQKIIERNGGRIWVESKPGEGSTFHFTIVQRPDSRPA